MIQFDSYFSNGLKSPTRSTSQISILEIMSCPSYLKGIFSLTSNDLTWLVSYFIAMNFIVGHDVGSCRSDASMERSSNVCAQGDMYDVLYCNVSRCIRRTCIVSIRKVYDSAFW